MLIIYGIYFLVTAVIIFAVQDSSNPEYYNNINAERFWEESRGQDRVVLIDDSYRAGISRINLIENARESIDIAYYSIHGGVTSDIFFAKLLRAADRGVEVRIILDGFFHNVKGFSSSIQYALMNHPGIELKFYEPLSLIKPWTLNNSLHEKYIIVDNKFAMMGGRNIGDKYFLEEYDGEIVRDRDIIIMNTDTEKLSGSVISDIKTYYNILWNHRFSRPPSEKLNSFRENRAAKKEESLKELIVEVDKKYSEYEIFGRYIDWYQLSVPTNNVTLIHNPLTRLNKEPWVLYELIKIMESTEEEIFIQSPYIIPAAGMLKKINLEEIHDREIVILTNSTASSPNYPAVAGYNNNRKKIVDSGVNLYEYQGRGSIHAKSFIFDSRTSAVGTFNVDARSSFLSTESMVVIDSEEFVEVLEEAAGNLIKESLLVEKDYSYEDNPGVNERELSFIKSTIINILRLPAYFLDFLL